MFFGPDSDAGKLADFCRACQQHKPFAGRVRLSPVPLCTLRLLPQGEPGHSYAFWRYNSDDRCQRNLQQQKVVLRAQTWRLSEQDSATLDRLKMFGC